MRERGKESCHLDMDVRHHEDVTKMSSCWYCKPSDIGLITFKGLFIVYSVLVAVGNLSMKSEAETGEKKTISAETTSTPNQNENRF